MGAAPPVARRLARQSTLARTQSALANLAVKARPTGTSVVGTLRKFGAISDFAVDCIIMNQAGREWPTSALSDASTSVRERNRLRRRRAIHVEGMRLFAERGYESTTVAEIAKATGLAPRTVALYYPAKIDIAMASTTDAAERLLLRMKSAGSGQPLTRVVSDWLRSESDDHDPEVWTLRAAMFAANPALGHADTPQQRSVGRASSELLARDLGVPVGHPAVSLAGGALSGILMSFVVLSAHHEPRALVELTAVALESLTNAFQDRLNRTERSSE